LGCEEKKKTRATRAPLVTSPHFTSLHSMTFEVLPTPFDSLLDAFAKKKKVRGGGFLLLVKRGT
jgi:hypothetical protein